MAADAFIHCRVSATTKQALAAAAQRQQLSESALLKRMIELMLYTAAAAPDMTTVSSKDRPPRITRLYVRISSGDWALLRERAAARCVAPATYASNLIRAKVRGVSPLLTEELQALKRSIAALGAIGNNLNQIARLSHQAGHATGPSREDLRAMLKVCEGLRDHVHGLMRANIMSWQSGDAPAHH